MCEQEDEWDTLISAQLQEPEDTVMWTDAVEAAEEQNYEAHRVENAKDKDMARKMQRIVDLETQLALKEGQTIVRGRKKKPIRIVKP